MQLLLYSYLVLSILVFRHLVGFFHQIPFGEIQILSLNRKTAPTPSITWDFCMQKYGLNYAI